jgi:hypothetical protein
VHDGTQRTACAASSCHFINPGGSSNNRRFYPTTLGVVTDAELITIIETGVYPSGKRTAAAHVYPLTDAQKASIPAYMRSRDMTE